MQAPVAVRRPTKRELHGIETFDDYAWLCTRDGPEVISYLAAENEYTDAVTSHLSPPINTMLDPSILLGVNEWGEWGNPAAPEQPEWLMAHSPYQRTVAADYPTVLATAQLRNPRVAYWEPAERVFEQLGAADAE